MTERRLMRYDEQEETVSVHNVEDQFLYARLVYWLMTLKSTKAVNDDEER